MTETRVYDSRVSHLEEKVSYGTLAILEKLAIHSTDMNKKNIILVNGDTVIRNCYNNKLDIDTIKKNIALDFDHLEHYCEQYLQNNGYLIIYFHPGIYSFINESFVRKMTPSREAIYKLSSFICIMNALKSNILTKINNIYSLNVFGTCINKAFAYKSLPKLISPLPINNYNIWMVTHCPIDYFITNMYKNIEFISSHTGDILTPKDFSKKVFGDENIPFNKTTYRFFGDKEFISPLCSNKPKAIEKLSSMKLKLKTEIEIRSILIKEFNLDQKLFVWNF